METADQKTGPGVGSLRRRSSVSSLSPPEYGNVAEGTGSLENENNYALIWWSGSGRHKRSCSFSSNSSSSSLSSPSWSPHGSGSSFQAGVPFSWEHRPGVPKQKPDTGNDFRQIRRLPLADPHCSSRRRRERKKKSDDDPFVTALVECMKEARVSNGSRRSLSAVSGYSCMRACATVNSQVAVPRARISKQGAEGFESSKECKKHNADKSSLQEPLLYCQNSSKSCRSENGSTELACSGKILRQQQMSWNVEFCRSVLHR